MKRRIISFLMLLCLLCALMPVAVLADSYDVDLYPQLSSAAKVWTVQVASGTKANCETCVKRLRNVGYNAFLYRDSGKSHCRICIGIFSSVADAEAFAKTVHEGPAVSGLNVEKAFGAKIQPGEDCEIMYAYPYWGDGPVPASQGARAADTDVPVDIFENCSKKVYAVQVASSTSDANTKTCVKRLRDRGYNAYVFKPADKQRYQLVIGAFDSTADARWLVDELHSIDPVQGVRVERAFVVTVYISGDALDTYRETDYAARLQQPVSTPAPVVSTDPTLGNVELFRQDDGGQKGVAVQVASSGDLKACVTCIKRLRDAGYNAYIFVPSGQTRYKLCIGCFSSKSDANGLLDRIKNGPAVKGVSMAGGFLINVYLPTDRTDYYSDWSY